MSEQEKDERTARLIVAYHSVMDPFMKKAFSEGLDSLEHCFATQEGFMSMLKEDGRFPEWPLDLKSKENQRKLQTYLWDTVREISEASACLKNRIHRVQEEEFDGANFLEEMSDSFAFFMESLILAGYTWEDLYMQYMRKMKVNREGLITGER